jgi:hypothetical protein
VQQAEDLMAIDELRAKLLNLDEQEAVVKRELDRTLDRHNHMSRLEADAKLALDFYAACVSMGLENLEPEQRRDIYGRLGLRITVSKDGSMEIEGEPKANWLPEGEIEPTEEAKGLERAFLSVSQYGKGGRGYLHGR